ncbi:MAG: RsmE family RNA methyltransferase [Chitinophagales bacterium]
MQLFYAKVSGAGSTAVLDENEAQHLRVLRLEGGAAIQLMDGIGNLWQAVVVHAGKTGATAQVQQLITTQPHPSGLHIAIAPTKNMDRLEWFVEKATELGIGTISLLRCERSERKEVRVDRLEKIALSAAKQSGNLYLPVIHPVVPIKSFLASPVSGLRCIATCDGATEPLEKRVHQQRSLLVLIGPEGDFSTAEMDWAMQQGYLPVSLGTSRLRTETAALYTAALYRSALTSF